MTFLRSALFNLFFFAATLVVTLFGTVVSFAAPHRVLDVARFWARLMVRALRLICGIDLQVFDRERLLCDEPMLIASRHQSAFDTIVWLTLLPRCCYVVKQELLRIPLFGRLVRMAGMIGVNRSSGAAAIRELLREGDRAVRESRQIVIFPEGTRGPPETLLPLQPGVAALAARTRLPVVPVVTDFGPVLGKAGVPQEAGHHSHPHSHSHCARHPAQGIDRTAWRRFAIRRDRARLSSSSADTLPCTPGCL